LTRGRGGTWHNGQDREHSQRFFHELWSFIVTQSLALTKQPKTHLRAALRSAPSIVSEEKKRENISSGSKSYSLAELAQDTNIEESLLRGWINAVDRRVRQFSVDLLEREKPS